MTHKGDQTTGEPVLKICFQLAGEHTRDLDGQ